MTAALLRIGDSISPCRSDNPDAIRHANHKLSHVANSISVLIGQEQLVRCRIPINALVTSEVGFTSQAGLGASGPITGIARKNPRSLISMRLAKRLAKQLALLSKAILFLCISEHGGGEEVQLRREPRSKEEKPAVVLHRKSPPTALQLC